MPGQPMQAQNLRACAWPKQPTRDAIRTSPQQTVIIVEARDRLRNLPKSFILEKHSNFSG